MIRQVVTGAATARIARAGRGWLARLAQEWERPELFDERGSLLLSGERGAAALREQIEAARQAGSDVELWDPARAVELVPALAQAKFEIAAFTRSDGTVDAPAIVSRLLADVSARGGEILYDTRYYGVDLDPSGRLVAVFAGDDRIATRTVVNAAGPWAGAVGELSGAIPIPLAPYRRHILHTGPLESIDTSWPYVWNVEVDAYFRPDRGGLLACACDHAPMEARDVEVEPTLVPALERKVRDAFPGLSELTFTQCWAGLRTFAPDGEFVIGPDTRLEGFHWIAGLGGHGITVGLAAAELAALAIASKPSDDLLPFLASRYDGKPSLPE